MQHPSAHGQLTPSRAQPSRRAFFSSLGLGFANLALSTMLADEAAATERGASNSRFPPRAKSVIWVFLSGGYSHLETFDPKPALNRYAGKTFAETPFENPLDSPLHRARFRSVPAAEINVRDVYPTIYPMQVGFRQHGQSGIGVQP